MIIPQRLYNEVMFLDNFTCVYCGLHTMDLTIDHFIPQSVGGPDVIQNLVAACEPCNTRKAARAPYEAMMTPRYGRFSFAAVEADDDTPIAMFQVLIQSGYSQRAAAKRIGLPESTLRRWYRKSRNGRPLRRKLAQIEQETP